MCQRKHYHPCQSAIHANEQISKQIKSCRKCVCGKWVCIECNKDHRKTSPNHLWCGMCVKKRPFYTCNSHHINMCEDCSKIHYLNHMTSSNSTLSNSCEN